MKSLFPKSRLYLGHIESKREDSDRDDVDLDVDNNYDGDDINDNNYDGDDNDNNYDGDSNDNNYDDDISGNVDQQSSSVCHREANRSVLMWPAHSDVSFNLFRRM